MGVKTKVFGRYAWLMFEGVGRFYDEYMAAERDPRRRAEMMDMTREFFFLVGFILPCVYCRISYREFLNTDIDVHAMLLLKDGGKKLVYKLHQRVTKKLWDQEREQFKASPDALEAINRKWHAYSISYDQAVRDRFPSPRSYRFWNAAVVFLALVMCDYRTEDACHIYRFFWILGRLLARDPDPLFAAYGTALEQTLPLWRDDQLAQRLALRLDVVWVLKTHVFGVHQWTFSRTRAGLEEACRDAIVGCGAKKA